MWVVLSGAVVVAVRREMAAELVVELVVAVVVEVEVEVAGGVPFGPPVPPKCPPILITLSDKVIMLKVIPPIFCYRRLLGKIIWREPQNSPSP